jgi:FkbM family methyltransferase
MLIELEDLNIKKKVKGIIHIGAHECEERNKYLNFFNLNDNNIIWIEALPDKVNQIKNINPNILIFNECIYDKDNENIIFHITNNYQSSSILKLKNHLIEHPHVYEINQIPLKTKTLKTFYKENNLIPNNYNFLNLDIQGTELNALKSAENLLEYFDYIYTEVNISELYENCSLLNDIDEYLQKFNFKRVNISMTKHNWGDAFYVKE